MDCIPNATFRLQQLSLAITPSLNLEWLVVSVTTLPWCLPKAVLYYWPAKECILSL